MFKDPFERALRAMLSGMYAAAEETEEGNAAAAWCASYIDAWSDSDAVRTYAFHDAEAIARAVNAWNDATCANDAHHIEEAAVRNAVAWFEEEGARMREHTLRARTLEDLRTRLVDLNRFCDRLPEAIDLTALPTYGRAPADTSGVYSWNDSHALRIDAALSALEDLEDQAPPCGA